MAENDVEEEQLDEDVDVPDELEDSDLEDLPEDDLLDDDLDGDDDEIDLPEIDAIVPAKPAAPAASDDDDEEEDDDEDDEDDVEASLDVILKEKLVVVDDEDEEEDADEATEQDERVDAGTKVLPKRPDEFVCQSCYLVKHPSQLADAERLLCRDCV